jgi:putative hemolysin
VVTAGAIIAVLIAVNALYVAAEFAAVASRRTRVEELADGGSSLARVLLPLVSSSRALDTYVAACQIGITLSSLVLGAYGQATVGRALAGRLQVSAGLSADAALTSAAALTLAGLVGAQVVLGELVPKSVAIRYPVPVALATAIPMRWSLWLFAPLTLLLNGSASIVLRLCRVPARPRLHIHAPEDIDYLVEESHEGGLLDDAERERLHNVLRLANRRVREVMVPRTRVFAIPADTPVEDLIRIATDSAYTRIPVYRGSLDDVLGLLHVKDLLAASAGPGPVELERLLRDMPRVPESRLVVDLLSDLRDRHQHMALVVDEYGGTSGIVTLEDLLEEVVGEIPDEYEKGISDRVVPLDGGGFRVPGTLPLADLAELTGLEVEDSESDTVAGLVMERLGRIPGAGEEVDFGGWRFRVEAVDGHSLVSVLVAPRTEESP